MREPQLIVCADAAEVAQTAARLIGEIAAKSIAERGRFTLALAGGSTPKATYQLLAARAVDPPVDWSKTYLFFGDERFVPHDDERSNFHMVRESLTVPAGIPPERVYPVPTDQPGPAEAARSYGATLTAFFGLPKGTMPQFDLVLLGLGDDGHCASLFPHAAALDVRDAAVTWSPPGVLPPPVDRITLALPAINAARHVLFLVAGANKAEALRDVWHVHAPLGERPAAGVRPTSGTLTWLVDRNAASLTESR